MISVTRPIRYAPSSPTITSVGVSLATAMSASRNGMSRDASWSMNEMSPPWSFEASVEVALAIVSQSPPPLRSARALSAAAFAAAFWASVEVEAPASVAGLTSIIHACRSSGVVASTVSWASMSPSVTVRPCLVARSAWIGAVDELLEREGGVLLQPLLDQGDPRVGIRASDVTGREERADPSLQVVGAERVDRLLLAPGVLRDGRSVHGARRRQVIAVPGDAPAATRSRSRATTTVRPKPMLNSMLRRSRSSQLRERCEGRGREVMVVGASSW